MNASLKTRAGQLMYRQLPEEYRYRDNPTPTESGDLEAYLHGFGHFFDLVRGTLEQLYADAFAEPVDNGRAIQPWLIPYLADLIGAELVAPLADIRREELARSVGWFKGKGSLVVLDDIADVVGGVEAVVMEDWRRVLTTPRVNLAPFTSPKAAMGDGDPLGPPGLPLGTPDLRLCNRAVIDPAGRNPLATYTLRVQDANGRPATIELHWKPSARRGAPCFPGHYDDTSLRTPDLRDPRRGPVGPHPQRIHVHVQPPDGFFTPGIPRVAYQEPAADAPHPLGLRENTTYDRVFDPAEIMRLLPPPANTPAGDRIAIDIKGILKIPAGAAVTFRDVNFHGRLRIDPPARATDPPTRVTMERCAADDVTLGVAGDQPALTAKNCLFGILEGGESLARLEYVTVLTKVHLNRLQASDCLFPADFSIDRCGEITTCIRYSRIPAASAAGPCKGAYGATNTAAEPVFMRRPLKIDAGPCQVRVSSYGEAGCGVLDLGAPDAIRLGAEGGGELGAYHHLAYATRLRALATKLVDFVPVGQQVAIVYDDRLSVPPAKVM